MTTRLLSIDPGLATGISLWRVPQDDPIEREEFWVVPKGDDGFLEWYYDVAVDLSYSEADYVDGVGLVRRDNVVTTVCEEFIQDGRTPRVDVNALRIEGMLKSLSGPDGVTWQRNSVKNLVGDKLLKQHGFWLTGKQVGWTDGRDVMDSCLHALYWAKLNHRPSLEFFWPKG